MNYVNNTIAVGAVATPMWLPSLADVSAIAAALLPIVGVLWLVIQIVGYLLKVGKDK